MAPKILQTSDSIKPGSTSVYKEKCEGSIWLHTYVEWIPLS